MPQWGGQSARKKSPKKWWWMWYCGTVVPSFPFLFGLVVGQEDVPQKEFLHIIWLAAGNRMACCPSASVNYHSLVIHSFSSVKNKVLLMKTQFKPIP
jgi:hypothetical protein